MNEASSSLKQISMTSLSYKLKFLLYSNFSSTLNSFFSSSFFLNMAKGTNEKIETPTIIPPAK